MELSIKGAVLRGLLPVWKQEKVSLFTGLAGVIIGVICLIVIAFRGAIVMPEGDISKAVSFDVALGVFVITTAILLPSIDMPPTKKRNFRWTIIICSLYSYGVETIQHLRGINPRFSQTAGVSDQIFGGLFGLTSLVIIFMYILLSFYIFQPTMLKQKPLFTLGLRYAMLSTIIAFAAGLWMIILQGRMFGESGNIIWLHGLGFHGLQAMPILTWLIMQIGLADKVKAKWIHLGGLVWILLILLLGLHTALGNSIVEMTLTSLLFYLLIATWIVVFTIIGWNYMKFRKINESNVKETLRAK